MSERDDMFDFTDQIFGSKTEDLSDDTKQQLNKSLPKQDLDIEKESSTAYLLSNAILHLLMEKRIIYPHEFNAKLHFLRQSYAMLRKDSAIADEVQVNFLLANTILNSLVSAGVLTPQEVQSVIADLHEEYKAKRGKNNEND